MFNKKGNRYKYSKLIIKIKMIYYFIKMNL